MHVSYVSSHPGVDEFDGGGVPGFAVLQCLDGALQPMTPSGGLGVGGVDCIPARQSNGGWRVVIGDVRVGRGVLREIGNNRKQFRGV